jgi:hypothetical protein
VVIILGAFLLAFAAGIIILGVNSLLGNPLNMTPGFIITGVGLAILLIAVLLIALGTPQETRVTSQPPYPPPPYPPHP